MATELDNALSRIMDTLTQPGQPFETVPFERGGVEMPALKNAPPSLVHYFQHYCAEHADKDFLVDGETRLTFAQAWDAARHVAAGLIAQHGVKRGDRVAIAARNSANWIIAYIGILVAGGGATLLNGFSIGDELADQIELVGATLVLVDAGRAKRLAGTAHKAAVVEFDHGGDPARGLASVWGDPATAQFPDLGPDDLATILYTSGSTGRSKGAWSDHRAVVHGTMSYVAQSLMAFTFLAGEVGEEALTQVQPAALVAVPLFHVTGEVPVFLQSLALGRKLVLMPKWDALDALKLMAAEKVTYFAGVPLMSYEIATHPDRAQYDLSHCSGFAAGGAPRPEEHVTVVKEAFPEGFPLLGYGLTETNGVGCANFNENYLAKPNSTGRASRPLVDLAILDDDGDKLPQGKTGEIAFRTVCNFVGYWNNEEATREAFTPDMYFRTGDLGYLDEDDYLFIVDRKKDIIIRGGENITCFEVEAEIYANPEIAECSVFGLPDDRYGEVPGAVYHTVEGSELSPDELRDFLQDRLASFKIPLKIWRSEEPLPRLGTQKIDKRTLRAFYASEGASTA